MVNEFLLRNCSPIAWRPWPWWIYWWDQIRGCKRLGKGSEQVIFGMGWVWFISNIYVSESLYNWRVEYNCYINLVFFFFWIKCFRRLCARCTRKTLSETFDLFKSVWPVPFPSVYVFYFKPFDSLEIEHDPNQLICE